MLTVGLTGGLASGKTFVGNCLKSWGCYLIQADQLGHEAIEPGGEAYDSVVETFGPQILLPHGSIDRRALARLVFTDPARLEQLNHLVHPVVFRREQELIASYANDPKAIVVVEAAIMIEIGSYKRYDRLIVAVCSEEEQIRRSMKRDGVTQEEAAARLRNQMPLSEKQKFADYVIDTSGTKEETAARARLVYDSLRSESL